MKLIKEYYQANDVDYRLHKYETKNGAIRFYHIDPFWDKPKKTSIRASTARWRIDNGYFITYEELNKEQLMYIKEK